MPELDLLQRYAARRDAEAFAQIVRDYQRLVFAPCRRRLHQSADLDDAVQETFLRLAQNAAQLRTNLGGWLHTCALNVATDLNRRQSTRQRHESAAARPDTASTDQQQLAELREQV